MTGQEDNRPNELIERATGGRMSMTPYLSYLRGKYGEFYRLPAPSRQTQN